MLNDSDKWNSALTNALIGRYNTSKCWVFETAAVQTEALAERDI